MDVLMDTATYLITVSDDSPEFREELRQIDGVLAVDEMVG